MAHFMVSDAPDWTWCNCFPVESVTSNATHKYFPGWLFDRLIEGTTVRVPLGDGTGVRDAEVEPKHPTKRQSENRGTTRRKHIVHSLFDIDGQVIDYSRFVTLNPCAVMSFRDFASQRAETRGLGVASPSTSPRIHFTASVIDARNAGLLHVSGRCPRLLK